MASLESSSSIPSGASAFLPSVSRGEPSYFSVDHQVRGSERASGECSWPVRTVDERRTAVRECGQSVWRTSSASHKANQFPAPTRNATLLHKCRSHCEAYRRVHGCANVRGVLRLCAELGGPFRPALSKWWGSIGRGTLGLPTYANISFLVCSS